MASSLHTLELRIQALEARLGEIETGYGSSLYDLRRSSVRTDLRLARLLDHFGVPDVTDAEVDQVLDEVEDSDPAEE
ncbi:hypothetical protein [Saccharothrix obliqua]|uniref:hypothetical protein n=1 Tax=Saccharothrix obliqua TaxID=2861747 RepID=UPI001C607B53|nr:hypothetical protein [Saccharothrix obliqua]MBW4722381.1 hypothetical protein [Saccharothrix obliqua]